MALPVNHPLDEQTFSTATQSIGATPLAAVIRAPFRGQLKSVAAVSHGTFITDCSIAIAIITPVAGGTAPGSGTAVSGSPLVITASNSAAGTSGTMVPSANTFVNEGDMISFTPSGSTGTTIGGTFFATIAAI